MKKRKRVPEWNWRCRRRSDERYPVGSIYSLSESCFGGSFPSSSGQKGLDGMVSPETCPHRLLYVRIGEREWRKGGKR